MRKFGISEFSTKPTNFYNLDAIIAVGYRVNSKKATRFRQWATKTLKEYIQKGFVLNDDLMKTAVRSVRITSTNCWSASARFAPVNGELIKKSRMSSSSAAMITTKTATRRKRSTHLSRTNCTTPLPARLLRN